MLAKVIRRQKWVPGTEVLEIGCGLGLPGIVAMSMGLRVIFSDYDECALRMAAQNAQLNGFTNFRCMRIDWRYPPDDLKVPVVLAADLVYEQRHLAPIAALIKKVLCPDGFCLLTDQDRIAPELIQQALRAEGLQFTTELVRAGEPQGRRLRGTLYRVTNGLC
jgi:predicted nicotinamide N-methyase